MENLTLDPSAFARELNLMLAFMRTDFPQRQLEPPIQASLPDIDWNQFLELVFHHRVYPRIYMNLKDSGLIPADVLQVLNREYGRNTFLMLHLSGEMERVCRALGGNGVRALALKGPSLAKDLYGDLSLRTSKDLDLLIETRDVERTEELLTGLGYRCDQHVPRVLNYWKGKVHHVSYTHPRLRIQVEIHWRLNSDMGKEPSFDELWERRRVSPLTSYPVNMLGTEDLFMYLVSHGARHGWFRLRWLADIDRIVRQNPDGNKLVRLLKRYDCLHLGGQALILASRLLGTPVPAGLHPLVSGSRPRRLAQSALYFIREMVVFSPEPGTRELARYYKRYLFSLKTFRQKAVFRMIQLYPSFRDAEALPLPRRLHFLYFPLRPFLWLWRQLRQQT